MSEFQGSKLYYFKNVLNRPDASRGEPVRLLLEDAGIDFEYVRVPMEDWPAMKDNLSKKGYPVPTLPYLVTKSGKEYSRVSPMMKRICKSINKYIPQDLDDQYLVDNYNDISQDWRVEWVNHAMALDDKQVQEKYSKLVDSQYATWDSIIGKKGGPYVFGQEITYVDFEFYALLREDDDLLKRVNNYPNIVKFIKTFEARPSLEMFFATKEYAKKL